MSNPLTSYLAVGCLALATWHTAAVANNPAIPGDYNAPGFTDLRDFQQGGFGEHIDPFSGQLKHSQTDYVLPGDGGLDIVIQRVYNNLNIVSKSQASLNRSTLGLGWDMHFGRVHPATGERLNGNKCDGQGFGSQANRNPVLETSDGTKRVLFASTISSHGFMTRDRWVAKCLPGASEGLLVESPDGMKYEFGEYGHNLLGSTMYMVSRIEDNHGNWLRFTYDDLEEDDFGNSTYRVVTRIQSNDGRRVTFNYANKMGSNRGDLQLSNIRIAGATITYKYELADQTAFSKQYFLSRVDAPEGNKWLYEYYESTPSSGRGLFSMSEVTTPGGGVAQYRYALVNFSASAGATALSTAVDQKKVLGKNVNGGTWTYEYTQNNSYDRTRVKSPLGCTEYRHIGERNTPARAGSGQRDLWRRGTLVYKALYSNTACSSTRRVQEETYSWDKLLISNQDEFRSFPAAFGQDTWEPVLTLKEVKRDGETYSTRYSNFDRYGNAQQVEAWDSVRGLNGKREIDYTYFKPSRRWMIHLINTEKIAGFGLATDIDRDYNSKGQLTQVKKHGLTTKYQYDSKGNVSKITDPDNISTSFLNYKLGVAREERRPESVTIFRQVDARGNIKEERVSVNRQSKITGYDYDLLNRVTKIKTPRTDDNDISFVYTNTSSVGYRVVSTRGSLRNTDLYDGFGRLIRSDARDTSSGGQTIVRRWDYDQLGRQSFQSDPNYSSPGSRGVRTDYDILGRVKKMRNTADSTSIDTSYRSGNRVDVTDEDSRTTTYTYTVYGDPDQKELAKIAQPLGITTTINRDKIGQIRTVIQGGITQRWNYFPTRPTLISSEERPERDTVRYTRNNRGLVTSSRVGSFTTTYSYDDFGREVKIDYPGVDEHTYRYNNLYNSVSEASKTTAAGTVSNSFGYDQNGNVGTEILHGLDHFGTGIGYIRDVNDNVIEARYGGLKQDLIVHEAVSFIVDAFGRIKKVGEYVNNVQYHANGGIKTYTDAAGVVMNYSHTNRGQIDKIEMVQPFTSNHFFMPVMLDYDYTNRGNVKRIFNPLGVPSGEHFTEEMTYDVLGRLTSAKWGIVWTHSFEYDNRNNINKNSQFRDTNTVDMIYTYDSRNRLTRVTNSVPAIRNFSYDVYGNVINNGKDTFAYDHSGNLSHITSQNIQYLYDGMNRKTQELHNGVIKKQTFFNQQDRISLMHDVDAKTVKRYHYLGHRLIAIRELNYN